MNKIKLGDVLEVKRGMSLPGEYYATEGDYIRLTLGNFNYPSCGWKKNVLKDNLFFTGNVRDEYILKKGDIITPLTEQVRGLLGNTATIPEDALYIQSGDIGLIIPDETKLDKRFSYYLVSSSVVKKQLDARSQQTKIRHTSPEAIKDCVAFIPIIKEQKKISYLLDCINKKIENNNAINDNLRASASIMFFNKIRYVQCSECCQETEIGRYPIEWTLSTLGDVLDTIIDRRGLTPTKLGSEWSNEGIIALSAKSVKNHELVNLDIANHVDNDLYNRWMPQKLQSQDILMTSEAPLGEFYYLADFSTYCLSQRLFAMRANKTIIEPTVLYFQLTDSIGKHQIDIRKTGTTVTGIRQSELIQVPIIVPPMNIQKEFARFCNPIMITIEKNADEIRQLFKLQEMLLSRLSR